MLCLQVLLFFLFGIPAFAQPEDTPSGESSTRDAQLNIGTISAIGALNVLGYWYKDLDDPNSNIVEIMRVMPKDVEGRSVKVNLGKGVLGTPTTDLKLKPVGPQSFQRAIGKWNRYPGKGNTPTAHPVQKAECKALSDSGLHIFAFEPTASQSPTTIPEPADSDVVVDIPDHPTDTGDKKPDRVHRARGLIPMHVEQGADVYGYWYREDAENNIRNVILIRTEGRGRQEPITIIQLGKVPLTLPLTNEDLWPAISKSLKNLTSEDIVKVKGTWTRMRNRQGHWHPSAKSHNKVVKVSDNDNENENEKTPLKIEVIGLADAETARALRKRKSRGG